MTARDQLIELHMRNRLETSSKDTTGTAMAVVAADLMIAQYGSAEKALAALQKTY